MALTERDIEHIAREVASRIKGGHVASGETGPELADGLFASVDDAVEAAHIAFKRLGRETLALRQHLIDAVREDLLTHAEPLARLAHEETGLGRVEDKTLKNRLVTLRTPGTEVLVPQAMTGDRGLTLVEPAPYGVIGAITPVTNPSSTLICNAIGMIAAGNSVVFNMHPSAKLVGRLTVQLLNRAIVHAGGPSNLVTAVADPTVETAQALMGHPGIRLLVVTGGPGVVKAAMRSGKRAICAGPGNPPVVVDETADIEKAGRDIVRGASFDNNIICVDEKEVFAVAAIADALLDSMARHGAYVMSVAEVARIERVIFAGMTTPGQPGT
ncbi:MAG: aldehyde dehydrogenase, partial [Candidatus Eisenbacteria bacterium]|nr:aldehyde dehydrogenase [Candidatus Eisenbacteria bacterium]